MNLFYMNSSQYVIWLFAVKKFKFYTVYVKSSHVWKNAYTNLFF